MLRRWVSTVRGLMKSREATSLDVAPVAASRAMCTSGMPVIVGVPGSAAGFFAGGAEFVGGSPGERLKSCLGQQFVGGAQVWAAIFPARFASKPFPIQEVRPGPVREHRALLEVIESFPVVVLDAGHQAPCVHSDPHT